jgi:ribonuclease P protein component
MMNVPNTPIERLKRRADFLAMRDGRRQHCRAFVLQERQRGQDESPGPAGAARFGFTVTKRIGNSVERNRIRRRLRGAVKAGATGRGRAGHDYVLVARREALSEPFAAIVSQLEQALDRLARRGADQRGPRAGNPDRRPADEASAHREG